MVGLTAVQRRSALDAHPRGAAARQSLTAALAAAFVVIVAGWLASSSDSTPSTGDVVLRSGGPDDPAPDAGFALLSREPGTRYGLGGLALDDDAAAAFDALGPPTATEDDMFGPTHVWGLPGSQFTVSVWAGTNEISAVSAVVDDPRQAPPVALHPDLVLGEATLGDVVEAWGEPAWVAEHPSDDFVVGYEDCRHGAPVLVKVDQPGTARGGTATPSWDRPVSRVLVAYADAAPGSGACADLGSATATA